MVHTRTESSVRTVDPHRPITDGRLLDFVDDPIVCMRRLYAEHGKLAALQQDSQKLVFAFGPDWNQRILSDSATFHSRFFSIRGPRNSPQRRLTSGLMTMNGEELKQHRRMVMGPFQRKSIVNYHGRICQLTAKTLDGWRPGRVIDLHEEMTQYMLRVTSAILFGLDMPEFAYRLGSMIDRWVELNHRAGMGAFVSDAQLQDNYDRLLALAEQLEADIRQMIHLRRSSRDQGDDVLSLLIRANEHEGLVSDEKLIGHTALLFGAAHLTTAHSFTWTLFLLAQHPAVLRGVMQESERAFRGDFPTLDDVAHMPVTERVLKESMRVLPASSYSQRINAQPIQLGPLWLPRGTPIIFSQFMTHHLPELYPDPETFRPDRWLSISPGAYEYLPFGAGPRMCLGGPLAMMILKTALPGVLKRYRLTVVPGSEINAQVISTMLGPTSTVPIQVSEQDGRFHSSPVTGTIHSLVNLPVAPAARKAA